MRRPSKKSSRSPLRLRPPNRNFDWISSALPWLPTEAPHARHLPWTNEWTKRSFRAPSTMFGEWRTNEQAMTRQKHDRHVADLASRMDNESSERCEPGLLCRTRVRATMARWVIASTAGGDRNYFRSREILHSRCGPPAAARFPLSAGTTPSRLALRASAAILAPVRAYNAAQAGTDHAKSPSASASASEPDQRQRKADVSRAAPYRHRILQSRSWLNSICRGV